MDITIIKQKKTDQRPEDWIQYKKEFVEILAKAKRTLSIRDRFCLIQLIPVFYDLEGFFERDNMIELCQNFLLDNITKEGIIAGLEVDLIEANMDLFIKERILHDKKENDESKARFFIYDFCWKLFSFV